MNRFCVITNSDKDKDYEIAERICAYICANGRTCVVTKDNKEYKKDQRSYTNIEEIPMDTECAIVLGGDGTFIQAANDLVNRDIPIMGVNLGTLGFLAETEKQNVEEYLNRLFHDQCRIESRMMIKGEVYCSGKKTDEGYSLNDIVINRSGLGRLIRVELSVNGALIDSYSGDGIIVATPTGSTGYNLSAGGPVLIPQLKGMVISPICPHSLNKRSLVVSPEDQVTLKIGQCKANQQDAAVAFLDGRITADLATGDEIRICKADVETKIVKFYDLNFYEILRNKLGRAI